MQDKAAPSPLIRPMLATLGELPGLTGWGYEFKWDGVRAVCYLDAGLLRLISRNDRDVTASYPELRALAGKFPSRRLVFDGEIIAVGLDGVPSFSRLQQRMHVRTPSPALVERVPVQLCLFDLLHIDDRSTLGEPYTRRRELLQELAGDDGLVTTPPYFTGQAGRDLLDAAADLGLEGVIAKRLDSPYQPGTRSRAWIKAPLNTTVEVVVAGWKPGDGRRANMIGSLLLGMYDEAGQLVYVGNVGTGFTEQMLHELARQLRPLATHQSPFARPVPRVQAREAHWVRPRLVGEVVYRTVTADGRLRHPAWRGLRPDKDPPQVTNAQLGQMRRRS